MNTCNFSYNHYKEIFQTALCEGYQVITLAQWFSGRFDASRKVLINRIDVDANLYRLHFLCEIFKSLKIPASVFFRLHAKGYNLLFFDGINIVKKLHRQGHEIGLHSEIMDVGHICDMKPEEVLRSNLNVFKSLLDVEVQGVASHGDMTPYNNLDFWKTRSPEEFGILYEAYDDRLWKHSRYISDSEYTQWKAYENGELMQGDQRCACEHLKEGVQTIYLLTHTCSYYDKHIHEAMPLFDIDLADKA